MFKLQSKKIDSKASSFPPSFVTVKPKAWSRMALSSILTISSILFLIEMKRSCIECILRFWVERDKTTIQYTDMV